jgi:hypothetical protein
LELGADGSSPQDTLPVVVDEGEGAKECNASVMIISPSLVVSKILSPFPPTGKGKHDCVDAPLRDIEISSSPLTVLEEFLKSCLLFPKLLLTAVLDEDMGPVAHEALVADETRFPKPTEETPSAASNESSPLDVGE